MGDVGLKVPLTQVCPSTRILALATPTIGTHKHCPKIALLEALYFVVAPVTRLVSLFSTIVAKHMFTRYHSSISQNGQRALVTAVNHRVDQLLADQIHLVVPSELLVLVQRLGRPCPTQRRERRGLNRVGQQTSFIIFLLKLPAVLRSVYDRTEAVSNSRERINFTRAGSTQVVTGQHRTRSKRVASVGQSTKKLPVGSSTGAELENTATRCSVGHGIIAKWEPARRWSPVQVHRGPVKGARGCARSERDRRS